MARSLAACPSAPSARIWRPVSERNTSSNVGRRTLIPSSGGRSVAVSSLTMKASPSSTRNVSPPSVGVLGRPYFSWSSRASPAGSVVRAAIWSLPTRCLSAAGVSSATMSPVIDDGDPIAVLGLVHVVGGEKQRRPVLLAQPAQHLPGARARLRIEPGGRLVEEQDVGAVDQAARDLEASLHAAREGARQILAAIVEVDELQRLVDPRVPLGARARGRRPRAASGSPRRSTDRRAPGPGR